MFFGTGNRQSLSTSSENYSPTSASTMQSVPAEDEDQQIRTAFRRGFLRTMRRDWPLLAESRLGGSARQWQKFYDEVAGKVLEQELNSAWPDSKMIFTALGDDKIDPMDHPVMASFRSKVDQALRKAELLASKTLQGAGKPIPAYWS